MKPNLPLTALLFLLVTACSHSTPNREVLSTKIALDIYGTQTAVTSAKSSEVTQETETALPSVNDQPETAQPTAEISSVSPQRLLLCYKAAINVQAQWAAHYKINVSLVEQDLVVEKINEFSYFRRQGLDGITVLDKEGLPQGDDTIVIDDAEFGPGGDCPYLDDILFSRSKLDCHAWIEGELYQDPCAPEVIALAQDRIDHAVIALRNQLMDSEQISHFDLFAVARPIRQILRDLYGLPLPYYLQGERIQG